MKMSTSMLSFSALFCVRLQLWSTLEQDFLFHTWDKSPTNVHEGAASRCDEIRTTYSASNNDEYSVQQTRWRCNSIESKWRSSSTTTATALRIGRKDKAQEMNSKGGTKMKRYIIKRRSRMKSKNTSSTAQVQQLEVARQAANEEAEKNKRIIGRNRSSSALVALGTIFAKHKLKSSKKEDPGCGGGTTTASPTSTTEGSPAVEANKVQSAHTRVSREGVEERPHASTEEEEEQRDDNDAASTSTAGSSGDRSGDEKKKDDLMRASRPVQLQFMSSPVEETSPVEEQAVTTSGGAGVGAAAPPQPDTSSPGGDENQNAPLSSSTTTSSASEAGPRATNTTTDTLRSSSSCCQDMHPMQLLLIITVSVLVVFTAVAVGLCNEDEDDDSTTDAPENNKNAGTKFMSLKAGSNNRSHTFFINTFVDADEEATTGLTAAGDHQVPAEDVVFLKDDDGDSDERLTKEDEDEETEVDQDGNYVDKNGIVGQQEPDVLKTAGGGPRKVKRKKKGNRSKLVEVSKSNLLNDISENDRATTGTENKSPEDVDPNAENSEASEQSLNAAGGVVISADFGASRAQQPPVGPSSTTSVAGAATPDSASQMKYGSSSFGTTAAPAMSFAGGAAVISSTSSTNVPNQVLDSKVKEDDEAMLFLSQTHIAQRLKNAADSTARPKPSSWKSRSKAFTTSSPSGGAAAAPPSDTSVSSSRSAAAAATSSNSSVRARSPRVRRVVRKRGAAASMKKAQQDQEHPGVDEQVPPQVRTPEDSEQDISEEAD
ncbi:unnamed protein product [Amoebophrya sp. A120]|nr:unnamed protein product [Amoebophrya sp. A120]|eukprot:GSA120T00017651001.1